MNRYEMLKAMHTIVRGINDENAYFEWVCLIPDEPTCDDLMDIANDDDLMADALKLFTGLVKAYCNSGTVAVDEHGAYL